MTKFLIEKGTEFDPIELLSIMDSFQEPLRSHLVAEPPAIVDLAKYSTPERPIDILAIADSAGEETPTLFVFPFDEKGQFNGFLLFYAGKKQVRLGFMFNTLPVFFLNMETVEFENGMWHEVFPPFKGVV